MTLIERYSEMKDQPWFQKAYCGRTLGDQMGLYFENVHEAALEIQAARSEDDKIVFANGCFDLLHLGHINMFRWIHEYFNYKSFLVIGINTDESVRRLKGSSRPFMPFESRIATLSDLHTVDLVIPFSEDDPLNLILTLKPDFIVKGEDWRGKGVVGEEESKTWGGKVVFAPTTPGYSTSMIAERIRKTSK